MKTIRFGWIVLLSVAAVASALGQSSPQVKQHPLIPLVSVLNPDGTINSTKGFSGSLDPKGWKMVANANGQPRFVKASAAVVASAQASSIQSAATVAGDDNWDDRFNRPGVDGSVSAITVSGTDVYVGGGLFGGVGNSNISHIARWDGTTWHALGDGVDGYVTTIAINGSNVYVGGSFTNAGGVSANHVACWNGSSWSALGSGVGGPKETVSAIAVIGTDVYVGGQFTVAGEITAYNIAKWNGSTWSALGDGIGGLNSGVSTIAASGTNVYVGGYFTWAGGGVIPNLARWDGTTWSSIGTPDDSVEAIAVSGSNLYVAGAFTKVGSVSANHIARWNGSTWSALGSGVGMPSEYVLALAIDGNDLYAAGLFSGIGGMCTAKWDGSSWSPLGGGIFATVAAISACGTNVYAGGSFVAAGGVGASSIARWNGVSWSPLNTGNGLAGAANAFVVSGNSLYVGGSFNVAGAIPANNIAKWDGASWSPLGCCEQIPGVGDGGGVNDSVNAIAISGGNVYVGGFFTNVNSVSANHIACWNGSSWSALGTGVNGVVNALAASGSELYVGGDFNAAGGDTNIQHIAKWDGSSWSALGSVSIAGLYGYASVGAIAVNGSDVYIGGSFTNAGGVIAYNIAKWDGSSWSALGSGVRGVYPLSASPVYALAVSGSDLYVGGNFTSAGGDTNIQYIAKWDGSSWSSLGSGVGGQFGYVDVIAVSSSNVYIGGEFTLAGGVSANHIACWNGSTWSGLGSGVSGDPLGCWVSALAVGAEGLYVGGPFSQAGGKRSSGFAIWHGPSPFISAASPLPSGTTGTEYSQNLMAIGGNPPYTWLVVSNGLPTGLCLVPSTGMITGTPTVATTANFTVEVTDSTTPTAQVTEKDFALTINPAVPTRIIGLSGSLTFGSVQVGTTSQATLRISNSGNSSLTVTNITYPAGFSGTWSGSIGASDSTNVTVTFAPTSATTYGGTVTVNSDRTSGTNTIAVSGTGGPASGTIADALDAPNLVCTTGGDAPWFYETTVTHDGQDAAASGTVTGSGSSWLQTTVTGPGTISFWWQYEFYAGDTVSFINADDVTSWGEACVLGAYGAWGWQQQSFQVFAGTHTLRWIRNNYCNQADARGRAWLDQVQWTPASIGGTYNGLVIETNVPSQASSGVITIKLKPTGAFTATFALGGSRYGLKGQFGSDGTATITVPRTGLSPLQVVLHLDMSSGTDEITGTVSDGVFTADLLTDRVVYGKTKACPWAGQYTFVLEPTESNPDLPQGYGYGTLTVAATGSGSLKGVLGDGTKIKGKVSVSKYGTFLLYTTLYRNQGSCIGWVTITNNTLEATVDWFKPPVATSIYYPSGFTTTQSLIGSRYVVPAVGEPMLDLTNATGDVLLTVDSGNLSVALSNLVTVAANNTVTVLSGDVTNLKLKLTPKTGQFSGSFLHPVTGKAVKFQGVVLQLQNIGVGYFLGSNKTGDVTIEPVP